MSRHHQKLNRRKWAQVRIKALTRDGYACVKCGKRGRLEVDHIVPVARGGLPYDLDNLQTLCRPCHFAKTAKELQRLNRDSLPQEQQKWAEFIETLI